MAGEPCGVSTKKSIAPGGFFNGTKTVQLYDSGGSMLAMATVSGNNTWNYQTISPIAVKAGQTYTVVVNLAGNGGSYRALSPTLLPKTYGNIQILASVYLYNSTAMPTIKNLYFMYGQVDVEFIPTQ